jgi:RimJ/RimL family protein N-acetyltransferase
VEAPDLPGEPVVWTAARPVDGRELSGSRVLLRSVQPDRDARELYPATHAPDGDPSVWTYLPHGPHADEQAMRDWLAEYADSTDRRCYTVSSPAERRALGIACYLNVNEQHGTIEVGSILFSPALQRTTAATEAIYLLMHHAFDALGYRRVEWKCNALNAPSRRAAERFGMSFEGIFRNHMVIKGRSRDSAWFAATDGDWPAIKDGFERWLQAGNFDRRGRQLASLSDLIAAARGR